jgi:hypothetical protein
MFIETIYKQMVKENPPPKGNQPRPRGSQSGATKGSGQ